MNVIPRANIDAFAADLRRERTPPTSEDRIAALAITAMTLAGLYADAQRKLDALAPIRRAAADILADVCREHSVSMRRIRSHQRDRHVLEARFDAIWRLINGTSLTMGQIGKLINRDHTSVSHAVRKIAAAKGVSARRTPPGGALRP